MDMAGIIDSLSFNQQMSLIYIGYFNRSADTAGFSFWSGQHFKDFEALILRDDDIYPRPQSTEKFMLES